MVAIPIRLADWTGSTTGLHLCHLPCLYIAAIFQRSYTVRFSNFTLDIGGIGVLDSDLFLLPAADVVVDDVAVASSSSLVDLGLRWQCFVCLFACLLVLFNDSRIGLEDRAVV